MVHANYEVRTSLDGYSATVGSGLTSTVDGNIDVTFPTTALYSVITTSVTIRIYGYNSSGTSGTWRLTNPDLRVTGTVNSTADPDITINFQNENPLNIARGSTNNPLFRVQIGVTSANATITGASFTTNGDYLASDIANNGIKLWFSADNVFDPNTDIQVGSAITSTGNTETLNFTFSQIAPINNFSYLYVTTDISSAAIINRTIGITNTPITNISFAAFDSKTGTAASGDLHTIIGLKTGIITPTSFCVTSIQGESVSVPFTYSPTSLYTGTFTAQLSDASGSFAAPTFIGSVVSDNSGSQTVSATIPAGTPQGSNYRIRVVSSIPNVEGADNGTDITIDLLTVSIAPTVTQNLSQFQNGDDLTATESHPIQSRRWKYSTTSGSGYTNFLGADPTQRPYFEMVGTYYMVVETLFACGKIVVSNEVRINVTAFTGTRLFPGDMAIVGWDAQIGTMGGDDDFVITNLVEITNGTRFLLVNGFYENGVAANTRTNEWSRVATIQFVYTNPTPLPAGTIISFELPSSTD